MTNVKVYRVAGADQPGTAYAWAIDEATGEDVFFSGSQRPMAALAEAVGDPNRGEMFPPNLIPVAIEEWRVIGRGPAFAYGAVLEFFGPANG